MRRLTSIFVWLAACGPPPTGTLYARISADPALAAPFTTEDGWTLSFSHVVVAVSSVGATGEAVNGLPMALAKPKLMDFAVSERTDLVTNTSASPRAYDTLSLVLSRGTSDDNVNVEAAVLDRVGAGRPLYITGTATKQSTTRQFELALPKSVTYSGCMPAVTVAAMGTATLDFRVHAQRLFFDDAGKMRFEAWALADTAPVDMKVENTEAASIPTSSLPPAQYGATTGSLMTVLEKRALTMVGLGDSGTCTGQ